MDLAGKDFLTMAEAAHYACVSERQWRKLSRAAGLVPFLWMGKKVYRKCDLQSHMEQAWRASTGAEKSGGSHGQPLRVGTVSLLAQHQSGKRNY